MDVGTHVHNSLQLAFANTIEAIVLGANRADGTLLRMGRGAGNCPLEILLGFQRNPKFDLRPILKVIQDVILPLREQYDWGRPFPTTLRGR
ncbi:MAG: hypothetical protein MK110_09680 [Fuerstiella sp.]|nr:hypothetical protein [Fuerstiella sp.]